MGDNEDRQTTMQFCNECNNLMYPKEVRNLDDSTKSRLVYVCRAPLCQVSHRPRNKCPVADSNLVWKHVVKHTMKTDDIVNPDMVNDPTLPRTRDVTCPQCDHNEAVYIQTLIGSQEGIALYFICTSCCRAWNKAGSD